MFSEAFDPIAADLEAMLELVRDVEGGQTAFFRPLLTDALAHPGKRLRPGLFLLGVRAAGPVRSGHHAVAAGLELIHIASLVHDDILDAALVRRQRPTLNARWGNRAAVLFGDLLFAGAFQLAASAGMERMLPGMARIVTSLCQGEGMQADAGCSPRQITPALARSVAAAKTAFFFSQACRMGVEAGGGTAAKAESLARFGLHFGMAYQLTDDVVDAVGSERAEGKTLRSDLRLCRPTLPVALLLERAPQAARLLPAMDIRAVRKLIALMHRTQALETSLARAKAQLRRADAALDEAAARKRLNGMEPHLRAVARVLHERCAMLGKMLERV